jgi:hypothetical protein
MTTPADRPWEEVIELTHAVCDQQASEDDLRRLDQLLRADPDARWTYLRHLHLCAELRWKLGASAEANTLNRLKSAGAATEGDSDDHSASPGPTTHGAPLVDPGDVPLPPLGGSWLDEWLEPLPKTWTPIQRLIALMILTGVATFGLGVLLALMIWPAMNDPGNGPGKPLAELGVASIRAVSDATKFSEASRSVLMPGFDELIVGSRLRPGRLELEAGTAELVFDTGARVRMTAPCRFEPRAPGTGFLELGMIAVVVPPVAVGFTVDGPGLKVVDLGTRFQMAVDEHGATDVRVDQGSVRLQRGGESTELVAGQRIHVPAGPSAAPLEPEDDNAPPQPLAQDGPPLVNGSFEVASRAAADGENRWSFRGWDHAIPAKPRVVRHEETAPGPFIPAAEGEHCVQFIGNPRGEGAGLRQTIETVPGARYQLGFALNRTGSRSSVPTIAVDVYSDPAAGPDRQGDLAHRAIRVREQPGRWTRHSLPFTATGNTVTIQFVEPIGAASRDNAPLLDAVTLKRLSDN